MASRIDGQVGVGAVAASKRASKRNRFEGSGIAGSNLVPDGSSRPASSSGRPTSDKPREDFSIAQGLMDKVRPSKETDGPSAFHLEDHAYLGLASPKTYESLYETEVDKRQVAKESAQARQARADMLGITTGALTTTPDMLKQLTEKAYNELSPRQRAAVDFNTMLSTAAHKDVKRQAAFDKASPEQKATYTASVEKMFGADGGSDIFAPETVAVLRQLKLPADKAGDLDQYLGLQVAITEDDLKLIDTKPAIANDVLSKVSTPNTKQTIEQDLTTATEELTKRLAAGDHMLQNFQATAAADRRDDVSPGERNFLGGQSAKAGLPALGFDPKLKFNDSDGTPADVNTYFQVAFDNFTNKAFGPDKRAFIMQQIEHDLRPPEVKAWLNYVDDRLTNTEHYGAKIGTTKDEEYRKPGRIRELLGLKE